VRLPGDAGLRTTDTTGEYAIPRVGTSEESQAAKQSMDSDAFSSFYQRSSRSLWAYMARVSGDPALADDLVQESYLRFLCASRSDEGEVAHRRYLFQIATNLMRDHWRRPRLTPLEDVPEEVFASRDSAARTDSLVALGPAMRRMRPRDRQLLWLAHAEGYSHKEIAEITGLATSSVRLLLFRARRKMAGLLREEVSRGRKTS